MPGPDNIFVITESMAKGARNGIIIALGLNSGVLVHTLAAATGISLILKQSALAFTIVQYAGTFYLLYLAYKAYKQKAAIAEGELSQIDGSFQLLKTGFIMNVLNPKVSLFFIAFLPQFVDVEKGSVIKQMIILGVAFMVIGFLTFSSFALLAHQLRRLLNKPKIINGIKWAKVFVLLILAIVLLLP